MPAKDSNPIRTNRQAYRHIESSTALDSICCGARASIATKGSRKGANNGRDAASDARRSRNWGANIGIYIFFFSQRSDRQVAKGTVVHLYWIQPRICRKTVCNHKQILHEGSSIFRERSVYPEAACFRSNTPQIKDRLDTFCWPVDRLAKAKHHFETIGNNIQENKWTVFLEDLQINTDADLQRRPVSKGSQSSQSIPSVTDTDIPSPSSVAFEPWSFTLYCMDWSGRSIKIPQSNSIASKSGEKTVA